MTRLMEAERKRLLKQAEAGFGSKTSSAKTALVNLSAWLEEDRFAGLIAKSDYRPLLISLIQTGHWDLLLDSFYRMLPFGTGGRRGNLGLGPNRLNPYTVAASIYGHVDYLRRLYPKQALSVVVAYDIRAFHDLRQIYPTNVANPLLSLTSQALAALTTKIYTTNGITVYGLPADSSEFLSTPELSFLIRHFKATAGLNVSASHNHPDDNGLKFYNRVGGQEVPPADQELMDIIGAVSSLSGQALRLKPELTVDVTAADRQAFIEANLALRLKPQAGQAKFVFTSLHGTGLATVGRCLEAMGYLAKGQLSYVAKQCQTRSDFKYVKYCNPNPESEEALEMGIAQALTKQADLVLATDPDADRLGGASPNSNWLSSSEWSADSNYPNPLSS